MKRAACLAALLPLLALAFGRSAAAQSPRYVPPGGAVLPSQLNYFRQDVGLLDPYNAFVAPTRRLSNQLQAMTNETRTDFSSTQRELDMLRSSPAAPTGVAAGFMNYSHYFSMRGGATAPAARTRGQRSTGRSTYSRR
jgi:hypothetical protein